MSENHPKPGESGRALQDLEEAYDAGGLFIPTQPLYRHVFEMVETGLISPEGDSWHFFRLTDKGTELIRKHRESLKIFDL